MLRASKKSRGFTLIELLVVVAIIAVLVAILIPALSYAKLVAKHSATQAQMSGIQMAIDSYYQNFRAYPGMVPEPTAGAAANSTYDSKESGGGGNVKYSDSQALVVSLSRYFCTGTVNSNVMNAGPGGNNGMTQISGLTPNTFVSNVPSVSPMDYSKSSTGTAYSSYYNPSAAELSTAISTAPTDPTVGTLYNQPTFIDKAYGVDALPILYYRAAQKWDPTNLAQMPVSESPSVAVAQYYTCTNNYLGDSTLINNSGVGSTYKNSNLNPTLATPPADPSLGITSVSLDPYKSAPTGVSKPSSYEADPNKHILTEMVGGVDTPRGAYVLISAGNDRIFGPNPTKTYSVDDIIVSGGGF